LQAYHVGYKKELYALKVANRTEHIKDISFGGRVHNNKMERFNGEIRDREKVTRNLKKEDSPILTGLQIYHNYVRPHMALDGKTPADLCGIKIEGKDRWLTLIQNAVKKDGYGEGNGVAGRCLNRVIPVTTLALLWLRLFKIRQSQ
jgi:hypothetical protein